MLNPFRVIGFVGSLALDAVEAVACSLSCDRTVHAMWEEAKRKARADAADALAEREAAEEVAEPSAFDHYASHVPSPVQCCDLDGYAASGYHTIGCPEWTGINHPSSAPGVSPTLAAERPQETPSLLADVETPAGTWALTRYDLIRAQFAVRSYAINSCTPGSDAYRAYHRTADKLNAAWK